MQALVDLRHKLLKNSLKPVTANKYEGQINQYLRFMGPAPLFHVWSDESAALWIFHCLEVRGLAKSTLKGRIPAFAYGVFKFTGRQCETGKDKRYSVLSMVSRAIDRLGDDVQRKIAVGKQGLSRCFGVLTAKHRPDVAIQLWAWWIVSYGAMLRCSEAARIKWDDVQFSAGRNARDVPSNMIITIRALEDDTFKTHQCSVQFRFAALNQQGVCPVHAMWSWALMSRRLLGDLPESVFSMSVDGVRKAFQEVAAVAIGGVPRSYGLHSLRAGGATDAEESGWAISEIMFMGRWRSPTVLVYLRQGDRWLHELGLQPRTGLTVRPTLFRG